MADEKPSMENFSNESGSLFLDALDSSSKEERDDEEVEEIREESDEVSEEEDVQDSPEDGGVKEEKKESKEGAKETEKVKHFTATLDDGSQVKLTNSSTLKVKVDGKFKRVAVQDLVSDYNGRIKHDELIRRASENEKELTRKLRASEETSIRAKELTKSFVEGITKGDLIEAISLVGEMTGEKDTEGLLNRFISGLGKAIEDVSTLSEDELKTRAKAYKTNSELKKSEARLGKLNQEEQVKAARVYKKQLSEHLQIEESELDNAYHAYSKTNEERKARGEEPVDFTWEDIATLALEYRHYASITNLIEEHELELEQDDINNLIDEAKIKARRLGRHPNQNEYRQLISGYANKELETIDRKVGTQKTTPKGKKNDAPKAIEIKRISEVWD